MYNTWKWSNGEPYYKSARSESKEQSHQQQTQAQAHQQQAQAHQQQVYDSQTNAINQSLADESFFNQEADISMFSRNQNASGTRREDIDLKMADRELISQRGVNPFLQTSYVNDVVARDMFLKPLNTTMDNSKEKSKEE